MESISITPAASALHQRVLSHLVTMAKVDKSFAWSAAKNYARLDPWQLATLPDDLTREMLKCSPST